MDAVKFVPKKNLVIAGLTISVITWASGIYFNIDILRIIGLLLLVIPITMILLIIGRLINRIREFQADVAKKMVTISATEIYFKKLEASMARDFDYMQRNMNSLMSIYSFLHDMKAPLPLMQGFAADPELGLVIINQIIDRKPAYILDIGSGLSTILAGYSVKKINHGHVIALEHHDEHYRQTARQIALHQLEKYITLLQAPLKTYNIAGKNWLWYDTDQIPDNIIFSLVIVDGPPGGIQAMARYPALPLLAGRIDPLGIILADDTRRPDEKQMINTWCNEFPELVSETLPSKNGVALLRYKEK